MKYLKDLELNLTQCMCVYGWDSGGKDKQVIVPLFKSLKQEKKWHTLFLICHIKLKGSIAVSFVTFFLCVCSVLACTWQTFCCRITNWNKSFGIVASENNYDVGRCEICDDPQNVTDKPILHTLWVYDHIYNCKPQLSKWLQYEMKKRITLLKNQPTSYQHRIYMALASLREMHIF